MAKTTEDMNIVALGFEDETGAENMMENIITWQEAGLLQVGDAVTVVRRAGNDLEIKQTHKFAGKYALGGSGIGLLAGLLLGGPIGGLIAGAVIGGISGSMKDYGIEDKFIRQVSEGLRPHTSALFVMGKALDREKLQEELRAQHAVVMTTTMPADGEQELRQLLTHKG